MKRLVILPPLLLVRQDFVGLLYILEALLALAGAFGVGIRMVLADDLTMNSLDIVLRRLSG